MENRQRANLRIPRRALFQWDRVKAKLTTRIVARGQEADGPTIFCEACALLDAGLGGEGIVEVPSERPRPFARPPGAQGPRPTATAAERSRKAADSREMAALLRKFADQLEKADDEE